MIKDMVEELERLQTKAGEEGWGREFREEMFDVLIQYFTDRDGRKSAGGLLCHMVCAGQSWFSETAMRGG